MILNSYRGDRSEQDVVSGILKAAEKSGYVVGGLLRVLENEYPAEHILFKQSPLYPIYGNTYSKPGDKIEEQWTTEEILSGIFDPKTNYWGIGLHRNLAFEKTYQHRDGEITGAPLNVGVEKYGALQIENARFQIFRFNLDYKLHLQLKPWSAEITASLASLFRSIYLHTKPIRIYGAHPDSLPYTRRDQSPYEIFDQWFIEDIRRKCVNHFFWFNLISPVLLENMEHDKDKLAEICWRYEVLDDGGLLLVLSPEPCDLMGTSLNPIPKNELLLQKAFWKK